MKKAQSLVWVVVAVSLARAALAAPAVVGSGAAEPWVGAPFAVEPRTVIEAAKRLPVASGSDVLVLFRDASYEFDGEGRTTYRQHMLYRLLTPQAVESWSEINVDYAPWHQARPEIRARVLTADAQEYRLDKRSIVEQLDKRFTVEHRSSVDAPESAAERVMLRAPLPALQVGAVVEEEVVVRDLQPFFAAGTAGSHPLRLRAPVHRGRLRLAAPTRLPLRYVVRLMPELKPRQRLTEDHVELIFEYLDVESLMAFEPGLPTHQPRWPQVVYSTGESWQALATAYGLKVDEKITGADLSNWPGVPSEAGATDGADSMDQRMAWILAELHNDVRYSGIELGASSLVPAAPDVTLERGFGDCKDQATLLVALLRRADLPAHVALLKAGFGPDVDPRLPGLGQFDHAVVYVATTPPVWIDPTNPSARVGELPATDQNRWALIAGPETSKLIRTPTANSIDNLTVEHREIYLADHGPGRVVERSRYHGEQERQQRRVARASSDENRREGYWEYLESTYLVEEMGEVEEGDPDDLAEPFTLRLEGLASSRAMTDLSEAVVAIRQEGLVASLPRALQEGRDPRRNAFVIEQPFITEWHYRIVPPSGFAPRQLPENQQRRFGSARYSRTFHLDEDGAVLADLRFDSGPRHLTAERFEEMRRGIQALLEEEPILLWFDHVGAVSLAAGSGGEALGHFRRLAELEPTRAIHRIRLAQALLRLGLGREAQRQANLATQAEPTSPLALWSLGFALEHDELGRRFSPGFDRPSALAALEEAVRLDPDNPLARTELAILLEYDNAGHRYAEGSNLDRAIDEYRILHDELGAKNLEINLVSALYWAERWQELYTATLRLHDNPVSRYLHLVALAILQGPDAAIRESWGLGGSAEGQLSLLNSAAQHLVIARRYPEAAALLRRAAEDSPQPEGILNRAAILARARRHEELPVKTETPAELATSLLQVLGQQGYDRERLADLFHPQYLADRGREASALESTLNKLREEQFKSVGDLPVEAVLDLALVILKTETDGDPDRGFRIRLLNQMAGGEVAFRVYVTIHQGRPVIAALESEYGQIGKEVLRRLAVGDLKGAHQWLDWARKAQPPVDAGDPYAFRPFSRYWIPGTGAFRDKMRLGAALLMANQPEVGEVLPWLEEAHAGLPDGVEPTGGERRILDAALFMAYSALKDNTRLGAHSAKLLEREPTSALAFLGLSQQLLAENRLDDLDQLAKERLALLPGNAQALKYLIRSAVRRSQLDRAFSYFEQLREADQLRPTDQNLWSWLLLFRDPVPEIALTLAQSGATSSQYRDRPMLHTLSAVYAEMGRAPEAYQVLMQSLKLREKPEPRSDDWYVYGRIVEEYGYPELAREYYGRVEPSPDGESYSAYDLARKRLGTAKRKGGKS